MIKKLDLRDITLVAIGSTKIQQTLSAIDICLNTAVFAEILFFSDIKNAYQIPVPRMNSIKDYDNFVIYDLPSYIKSKFCLTIHWDGFIVNPKSWTDEFLEYDYIGAPWPWMNFVCGNGGFCLKSKKFLVTQEKIVPQNRIRIDRPDDVFLCIDNRQQFEKLGCKYAPRHIAQQFSTEYGGYHNYQSFGFHDFRPNPQFKKLISL